MPPIITTLGVNSFRPAGGGANIPTSFDALLIASGGSGYASSTSGGGGGGGIVSFTNINPGDNWSITSNESGGDGINYDFTKQFSVTIGAAGYSYGSTYIRGYNVANGNLEYVHNVNARTGGNGQTQTWTPPTTGGSGGGGWSGTGYPNPMPNPGANSIGSTYGGLNKQGNAGGDGVLRIQLGSIYSYHGGGGGGGFGGAGGNATLGPWPNYTIYTGYGGSRSTGSQQIWLGMSDNSPYNGEFSGGSPTYNSKAGDSGKSGIVAIRFDNAFPDPTVSGNPQFYDDTTNNKRIIVFTGAGTFQWGV